MACNYYWGYYLKLWGHCYWTCGFMHWTFNPLRTVVNTNSTLTFGTGAPFKVPSLTHNTVPEYNTLGFLYWGTLEPQHTLTHSIGMPHIFICAIKIQSLYLPSGGSSPQTGSRVLVCCGVSLVLSGSWSEEGGWIVASVNYFESKLGLSVWGASCLSGWLPSTFSSLQPNSHCSIQLSILHLGHFLSTATTMLLKRWCTSSTDTGRFFSLISFITSKHFSLLNSSFPLKDFTAVITRLCVPHLFVFLCIVCGEGSGGWVVASVNYCALSPGWGCLAKVLPAFLGGCHPPFFHSSWIVTVQYSYQCCVCAVFFFFFSSTATTMLLKRWCTSSTDTVRFFSLIYFSISKHFPLLNSSFPLKDFAAIVIRLCVPHLFVFLHIVCKLVTLVLCHYILAIL